MEKLSVYSCAGDNVFCPSVHFGYICSRMNRRTEISQYAPPKKTPELIYQRVGGIESGEKCSVCHNHLENMRKISYLCNVIIVNNMRYELSANH